MAIFGFGRKINVKTLAILNHIIFIFLEIIIELSSSTIECSFIKIQTYFL